MKRIETYYPVFIGRIFFFLLGIGMASHALAQVAGSFDARAAQPLLEVRQGNVVATSVIVRNSSDVKKAYRVRVVLPQEWRPVLKITRFELLPGQSDTRLLSFSLPASTSAGTYLIRYFIADEAAPAKESVVAIEVLILPVLQLELKILEAPRFVVAGQHYVVQFALTNRGNVGGFVNLKTRNFDDFLVRIDSSFVSLNPKQTRTVTAFVITSGDIRGKIANTLELTAQLVADSTVRARTSSVVDVIPRVAQTEDRYLQFPLQVTGRAAGEDDRLGGQIEVSGTGSFTEDRSDRLDLMVRTPDIQSQSSIGLRDEYRLRYTSSHGELQVGDWSYSLSPLTELSRYAFGGKGTVRYEGVTAGGYFNESRFLIPNQRQFAGFLSYTVQEGYEVGVNYLRKNEQFETNITSVRGIVRPIAVANIDVEYGVSSGGKGRDDAFAAQVSGQERLFSYDARFVHAGASYNGYYRDVDYQSFALNVTPFKNVRMEAYYRDENRNLNRDTSLFLAPRERYVQIGGGYSSLFAVYFRSTLQEDLLPVSQYRRHEQMAQIRLGYSLNNVSLYSNIDLGSTRDRLTDKTFPFQRYALYSSFNVAATQNYGTSLEYSTERDLFTGDPQDRISTSVNASWFLTAKTNLQATVYWTKSLTSIRQDYTLLDFTLQHVFPFQHRISVRARQNYSLPSANGRELAYMLQYSVPVGVPVKRLTSTGQLRGKIVDDQGRGMGNVLINVSASASLTESDGEFFFPSLSPGEHFLVLDKATIGIDRVATVLTPLSVMIAGGKETKLDIHLVRSGAISGVVRLFAFDEADSTKTAMVEMGKQSGLIVEISNGMEIQRRVSDNKGRFAFSDLRPGRWILQVVGGTLPQYHFVEQQSLQVDLGAGSKQEVTFNVLPRKRSIRIIETGTIQQPQPADSIQQKEECLISFDVNKRGYMVHVSSWETLTKATERARAAESVTGLKASIDRSEVRDLGTRYRVKVGPFKSKAEADSFCTRLLDLERKQ